MKKAKFEINVTVLRNVMNYNGNKGAELCRQSKFVKNHDDYEHMMKTAGRHYATVDRCRRMLWLAEHSRHG